MRKLMCSAARKSAQFLLRVESINLVYYLSQRKEIILMKKRYSGPQIVAKFGLTDVLVTHAKVILKLCERFDNLLDLGLIDRLSLVRSGLKHNVSYFLLIARPCGHNIVPLFVDGFMKRFLIWLEDSGVLDFLWKALIGICIAITIVLGHLILLWWAFRPLHFARIAFTAIVLVGTYTILLLAWFFWWRRGS